MKLNSQPFRRRLLSALLCLSLLAGLFALTGCDHLPWDKKPVAVTYPFVFVHGLNGSGENGGSINYWGSTAGNLLPSLREAGFSCVAPTLSLAGSAWDEACELYAQLCGGRVDYGKAHSEKYGHDRFGETYATPLVPGWGTEDANGNLVKINLVGHSFGGAVVRTLLNLLANGSPAEQAALPPVTTMKAVKAKNKNNTDTTVPAPLEESALSPLFEGGKGSWVFSLTALASPHNGTSALAILDANSTFSGLANLLDMTGLSGVSSLVGLLGQFDFTGLLGSLADAGLMRSGGQSLEEIKAALQTGDNAYYDLSIPGAEALNATMGAPLPGVYYFSLPVDGTEDSLSGNRSGGSDMSWFLRPLATVIGSYRKDLVGSQVIDARWLPNDGLVNTISATAPFREPSAEWDPAQAPVPAYDPENFHYKDYADQLPAAAQWNIFPTLRGDHGTPIGMSKTLDWTRQFYLDFMKRIDELSKIDTGTWSRNRPVPAAAPVSATDPVSADPSAVSP
ncbi:MAG: hypothetical protein LBJ11_01870 [Oscillospiraceae bacterium]|jgi:triacylglycerol lipase|nr:hypothetical protein [Oscillospiraceae bacterium]